MRSRAQWFFGGILILFGFLLLLSNLFDIDFGAFCLPTLFIVIGVIILLRPRMLSTDTLFKLVPLGDIRRRGEWQVQPEEFWFFLGSLYLDLSEAQLPLGETTYRIFSFIGDVRVYLPEEIGVSVSNIAFISDDRYFGMKRGGFFTPVEWSSEGYEDAERKLRIERFSFLGSVKVRRPKES
jgi:predicted membrane protein